MWNNLFAESDKMTIMSHCYILRKSVQDESLGNLYNKSFCLKYLTLIWNELFAESDNMYMTIISLRYIQGKLVIPAWNQESMAQESVTGV